MLAAIGGTRGRAPRDALAFMSSHAVSRPVLVDVTSDETSATAAGGAGPRLQRRAGQQAAAGRARGTSYTHLLTTAADAGRTIRFEATVGAGLPVIDTYKKLAETGDRVLRIDGCVSGTLMFVLSEVSRGRPFSAAVLDAVAARLCRARSARRPVGAGRRPQGR